MVEVPLSSNWSFDVEEFSEWADSNLPGGWDFKTTNNIFCPTLVFTNEEDALAFKLKFKI